MSTEKLMVSVAMITYGHEKFIKNAIQGILMQECKFEFELIIANDCSPDKTDTVVQNIIESHPKAHRIVYTKHISNKGMMPNFFWAIDQCKGKYIAFCEGDDYWTDPLKLQNQVDFLETNPEYGLVHTDVDYFNVLKNELTQNVLEKSQNYCRIPDIRNVYLHLLTGNYSIRTLSVCLKRELAIKVYEKYPELQDKSKFMMGDGPLWIELSKLTRFHYMPYSTGVYNILPESATHSSSTNKIINFYKSHLFLLDYFDEKYGFKKKNKTKNILVRQLLFDCIKRKNTAYCKEIKNEIGQNLKFDIINIILYRIGCSKELTKINKFFIFIIRSFLKIKKVMSFNFYQKMSIL